MGFVHPALLGLLAAAVLPLAIHLIGRRRGRRVGFGAIDFLLASERRLARRRRLVNLLLLLARVGLVLALALAVARPWLPERGRAAAAGEPESVVALIDLSLSMRARVGGRTRFELARRELERAIAELAPGSELALIGVERQQRMLTRGFEPPQRALEQLERLQPGFARAALGSALADAEALALSGRHAARRILLASDLQASGFESGYQPPELPLTSLLEPLPAANAGLLAATLELADDAARVEASALREGEQTPEVVQLLNDGRLLERRPLAQRTDGWWVSLELAERPAPGSVLELRLEGQDALAEDDWRWLVVEQPRVTRVLALNGSPAAVVYEDELFYLGAALEADRGRDEPLQLDVADASGGHLPGWSRHDVVLLANVERVPAAVGEALGEWVERGGGLLLSLGDQVDASAWNRTLAGLLPALLERESAGPGETGLEAPQTESALLAPLAELLRPGSGRVRIDRLFELSPNPDSQVLLRLGDGRPLLVWRRLGRGQVALLATSIDRDWSELPLSPLYLPLMERSLRALAGTLEDPFPRQRLVGQPVRFPSSAGRRLTLVTPDGRSSQLSAASGEPLVFEDTASPGVYRVADSEGQRWDFAVHGDPRESQLTPLPALESSQAPVAGGGDTAPRPGRELASALALAALLALALESLLVGRS